ncbi:MAG: restriction endonuclease subunit S [Acidobacteriota bacterium]|nr:restriction endonuclease subunit S [Acidobacteriota bacterium]
MAGKWVELPLGEVVNLKRGYDLPAQDRQPGPHPVVSSSGITGHHIESKVKGPGVVTGRYGTLGEVHYVVEDFWPLNTTLYVQDFKGNYPRFISYLLQGLDFQAYSDKSSVPGLNRNHLHAEPVRLPLDIEEQRAIAIILGSLDDKIELNQQTIKSLYATARAIFKAWFIDFEPVKAKAAGATSFRGIPPKVFEQLPDELTESELGPIPKGWEITAIADIAGYVNGKAFTQHANGRGRMIIRIAELNSGSGIATAYSDVDTEPQYTAFPDDILFAWSGSLGVYRWHRDEAIINQHIFKVIPTERPKWYVYHRLVEAMPFFQAVAATKATTMGHIKRGHLSEAVFIESPKWLIEAADNLIRPLFDLIHSNERESFNLAAIRDTLLPRLISGELRASGGMRV